VRVLFVVNTLPPQDLSGVGEQVVQLANGLRQLGVEVEILGRGKAGVRGPKWLYPLTVVPALGRSLENFKPHVVQVHESDGGLAVRWLSRWMARKKRPLLVALQQVSYIEEGRAVRTLRWKGKRLEGPGWRELGFRYFKVPFHVWLGRWTVRAADLVLAPSVRTAEELVRDYGASEVKVLPNTTSGPLASPEPVGEALPEQGFLLFVGRLRLRKGLSVLLEALRLLQERGLMLPLVVAGDGEQRASLQAAARRLGISHSITWLGRVSRGQVRYLLERATLLVVPSIYEGLPLVLLEALVMGVPVVASRVSGIPEVLGSSGGGWLVEPEDPEALAEVLAVSWQDPEERRVRAMRGQEFVRRELAPKRVAERWLEMVKPLVKEMP
jgi:glycosyltransferase involved in cell wall biosynthesis